MFLKKSYTLYNSFFKRSSKMGLINPNRTFIIDNKNYINSNTNLNSYLNSSLTSKNFPFIKSYFNSGIKRSKSFKENVDYKFYKILKKYPLTPKNNKKKIFFCPGIVSKSPFNFEFKDQDEMIKRIKRINKGNKKHKILCDIAHKKEIEKRKKARKFLDEMRLNKINIRLVKRKIVEEKKVMNELNNSHKKKIFRLKNMSFEYPHTTKNLYNSNSGTIISFRKLFDKERKLVIKKDKLMHRFHEIMNKINSQTKNEEL